MFILWNFQYYHNELEHPNCWKSSYLAHTSHTHFCSWSLSLSYIYANPQQQEQNSKAHKHWSNESNQAFLKEKNIYSIHHQKYEENKQMKWSTITTTTFIASNDGDNNDNKNSGNSNHYHACFGSNNYFF